MMQVMTMMMMMTRMSCSEQYMHLPSIHHSHETPGDNSNEDNNDSVTIAGFFGHHSHAPETKSPGNPQTQLGLTMMILTMILTVIMMMMLRAAQGTQP